MSISQYISLIILGFGVGTLIMSVRTGSFKIQLTGILIIIASVLVGFVKPLFSRYLAGPRVDLDLLYALLHMRIVASGKPPATKVLEAVSDERLYNIYSKTFGKAYVLAKEWGYNVSEALSYIAKNIEEKAFREVVQRLAVTIRLGADLERFLETEYNTLFHEYQYHYQRVINNMRVILGVYVATMAALVFALSSFMLLGFFFGGSGKILIQAYIASIAVTLGLGGLITIMLPKEFFDVKGSSARENRLIMMIDLTAGLGLIVSILAAVLFLHGKEFTAQNLSLAIIITGIPLIPAGVIALIHESRVQDVDVFFPVFIRSLGSFIATIPSLKHAIRQVLRTDLGRLTRLIERFHVRLENEIPPQIAWKRFSIESGSELVRRGSKIFQDAIEYGGNPELTGVLVSDHNNVLLSLRRLRAQVSSNFTSTGIIIHATVVAISVFIMGLVSYFNQVISALMGNLTATVIQYFFLAPVNIEYINKIVYLFIFSLTIINAYLITVVRPYSKRAFWFFAGIMAVITGISAYFSTLAVEYVLRTMAGIEITPIPTG
jgi:archaellum biogenesis protein FlaJ (TadC family)